MSEPIAKPEITEPKDLFAKPGIAKAKELVSFDLAPGFGRATPIAASSHRYCGMLTLGPGDAFNFHHHPRQDEVIYVIEGRMEGWVNQDRSVLGPGDVIFAPAGTVHASFNTSQQPLELFTILSPLIADVEEEWRMIDNYGWEMVDVSGEEPWVSLRKT